jgi:1,4-alpha-glucan branching enzyme
MPRLSDDDLYLWDQGTYYKSYDRLGAHPNQQGTWFRVWAPNADHVEVIGDFNDWLGDDLDWAGAGLWEGYVRGARPGRRYKFRIHAGGEAFDKTDPYAFRMEPPTGSDTQGLSAIITDLDAYYDWQDSGWMNARKGPSALDEPMSVYEVHLGSWMKKEGSHESLSYREIAEPLADHALEMGFTHVEFLPLAEHPYYGSWGYQIIGYYAPTFRYGSPQDLMYLIDELHQRGLGVIMDWVPGHFAPDPQGLARFDGTPLFEYADPQMQRHPDWGTFVFDFKSAGVRNFLVSNALFWLDKYHIDGLRVDAVASMLYRDYSRGDDWTPNEYGGNENLEAIQLLKDTNEAVYSHFPEAVTTAEESTAFPGVSQPTYAGGLGFLYKWNLGWMNDTLAYFKEDPVHRKYHHNELTFSLVYAFSEQYTLPLSHDEVVHMKGSIWDKMAGGDDWQTAANMRLLYAHQTGHPGKQLLFMGDEFGQRREWNHNDSLDWHLTDEPLHAGVMNWVRDLNALYTGEPALWKDAPASFEWVDADDYEQSVLSYLRTGENGETLLFVLNMTPVPRHEYRIGVLAREDWSDRWREVLNSDAEHYGGSGVGNYGGVETDPVWAHDRAQSVALSLPPLGALVLKPEAG